MNQQSELASKLKDVLSKMTQEEFDKEWSKVTSLNLESPSIGSGEPLSQWLGKYILQQEISDEEIFKQAILAMEEMYGSGSETEIDAYFRGAKWMQEQLRQPK